MGPKHAQHKSFFYIDSLKKDRLFFSYVDGALECFLVVGRRFAVEFFVVGVI